MTDNIFYPRRVRKFIEFRPHKYFYIQRHMCDSHSTQIPIHIMMDGIEGIQNKIKSIVFKQKEEIKASSGKENL